MYTKPPTDPIAFVDWYLDHMGTNLNKDMKAVHVWDFTLRTKNVDSMHALAKALRRARYLTTIQEVVIEVGYIPAKVSSPATGTDKGTAKNKPKRTEVEGPPMVTALYRAKPNAAALKRRVRAMIALAQKHDATYASLGSMDMEEFEMFYGPPKAMALADACWRLRHHSDTGLKQGATIEFTFCLVADDVKACMVALKKAGFSKVTRAPKDANWAVSVSIPGANNEKRLKAEYAVMKKAAKAAGGTLKGLEM
jgi:hypothetical protein